MWTVAKHPASVVQKRRDRAHARRRRLEPLIERGKSRVTSAITPKIASPVQSAGFCRRKYPLLMLGDLDLQEAIGECEVHLVRKTPHLVIVHAADSV